MQFLTAASYPPMIIYWHIVREHRTTQFFEHFIHSLFFCLLSSGHTGQTRRVIKKLIRFVFGKNESPEEDTPEYRVFFQAVSSNHKSQISTCPEVGSIRTTRIRIKVDLHGAIGPNKPNIPAGISRLTSFKA